MTSQLDDYVLLHEISRGPIRGDHTEPRYWRGSLIYGIPGYWLGAAETLGMGVSE
jgi:hypothetical protein